MSDRLEEMERLSPGGGALGAAFWDSRADRYAANVKPADADDPFLRRLRRVTDGSSTVIDVGAGTGRYAVPLAASVAQVTAVDPSDGMLGILRREAGERRLANVTTILGTWEEAEAPAADVAFSSFVVPLIADVRPFLSKLDAAARRDAFLYLGAYSGDAVLDPLWRHFHGSPRAPGASYLDAIEVLHELGIAPEVRVVEVPNRRRFATVAEAAGHYSEALLLDDAPETRRELERLLESWLMGRKGAFRSPMRSGPAAILHWSAQRPSR